MANHPSSRKRARRNLKRALRNKAIKSNIQSTVKSFHAVLTAGDAGQAKEVLLKATQTLRKAASKGVLHSKTASRRVSRLTRAFNKMSAAS